MITTADVARASMDTGFRSEMVEKVLRLHGILDRLDGQASHGLWLLKGGTALNLLHQDIPRLSVYIDLNFVGSPEVDDMKRIRPEFERTLVACCEREGCSVRRLPVEDAGGKLLLRYPSVLGGSQNLEVDVSYVARVPLWGVVRLAVRFPPDSTLQVPTLTIGELAAGKFAALVQRSAARDAYDAACLIDLMPDLIQRPEFRVAFVCSVAATRTDIRALQRPRALPSAADLRIEVGPLLRRGEADGEPGTDDLAAWISDRVPGAVDSALAWSIRERRFLDRLIDDGEIDAPALHDDPEVQDRIRKQPMLVWKAGHVRAHKRGD